ncbi:hypothetical protein C4566_00610 [Candidatus Parcubacteria bacterium]|nr:MAG: hypothetical protein C4566_00610 [Candidatus Parcubacteria bacterium]
MTADKGINLMPEDLRSKEDEALAKKRSVFDLDLVTPNLTPGQATGKPTGGQESFWSKFLAIFKPKVKEPKIKENKVKDNDGSILAREIKRNKDTHKEVEVVEHKIAQPQTPAINLAKAKNGNGSILAREIKRNGYDKLPETKPELPKIEEKQIKNDFFIPEEPKLQVMSQPKPEPEVPQPEKKDKEKKEEKKKAKKPEKDQDKNLGFHEPEARVKSKFMSEGGGVDLIPTSVKVRSWRQISNLILLSLIGSVVIVGIFYGSLFIQERNIKANQANRDRQISDLEVEILKFEAFNQTIDVLGKNIKMTHEALNKHIHWINFFELLEKYTVSDVYYHGFAAGNDGALTLSATGGSYDSVAKQLKLLQQDEAKEFVQSVAISGAQMGGSGVEFSMVLVLNPDIFYYQEDILGNDNQDNDDDQGDDQGQRN